MLKSSTLHHFHCLNNQSKCSVCSNFWHTFFTEINGRPLQYYHYNCFVVPICYIFHVLGASEVMWPQVSGYTPRWTLAIILLCITGNMEPPFKVHFRTKTDWHWNSPTRKLSHWGVTCDLRFQIYISVSSKQSESQGVSVRGGEGRNYNLFCSPLLCVSVCVPGATDTYTYLTLSGSIIN